MCTAGDGAYEIREIPTTGEHEFGDWIVTKQATSTENGEKIRYCKNCDAYEIKPTQYELDNDKTPSDDGETKPGKIENITKPEDNAFSGSIDVDKQEILDTFPLDNNECSKVENGSDISLKLEVKDATEAEKTPAEEKMISAAMEKAVEKLISEKIAEGKISAVNKEEAIAEETKNCVLAAVLDITIEKYIDGVEAGKVTDLKQPLRIYIDLPKGVYQDGRNYFIIREHNGEYEALALHIIDKTRAWFESDKYSKFYIMYTEKAAEPVAEPEPVVKPVVEPVVEPEPAVEPAPVVEPEPVDPCADGHEYGEWKTVQNASWLNNGIEERTCGDCGEKETRVVEENWLSWAARAIGRRLRRLFG